MASYIPFGAESKVQARSFAKFCGRETDLSKDERWMCGKFVACNHRQFYTPHCFNPNIHRGQHYTHMSYAEFQKHFEQAAGEEKARYDALPVAKLLAFIRARRFGEFYQLWHSVGERATVAEAANDLLNVLESNATDLNRYHCASALIAVAGLGAAGWTAEQLSAEARFPIRQNIQEIRELIARQPTSTAATPNTATPTAILPIASPVPTAPPRSALVTALAWVVIVGSALATPISVVSCLMLLVGSYGTKSADPIGGLIVVGGPFAFLLAGIGLLRRKRWAYYLMLAALLALLAYNVYGILRGPSPAASYVSADGVPTTVLASEASYALPFIAICVCILILLLAPNIRSEFGISRRTHMPTER